jgi:rhodanese-related sulfurtransferase
MLTLAVAVLIAFQASADARQSIEFTKDSLEAVKKNVAAGKAVLVDVRSKDEWDKGHVEGSIFLPVTELRKPKLDPKQLAKALPNKKVIYTFCVVGMRAKQAGTILEKQGYPVRVLKPGYDELIKAGFKKAESKKADENTRQRNAG